MAFFSGDYRGGSVSEGQRNRSSLRRAEPGGGGVSGMVVVSGCRAGSAVKRPPHKYLNAQIGNRGRRWGGSLWGGAGFVWIPGQARNDDILGAVQASSGFGVWARNDGKGLSLCHLAL